jgi:hypothetical protein
MKGTTDATAVTVSLADNSSATDMTYIGTDASGKAVALRRNTGGIGTAISSEAVTDGEWHYVIGHFLSATSAFVEVDGVMSAENTSNIPIQNLYRPAIGREDGSTAGQNFTGLISGASISDQILCPLGEEDGLPYDVSDNGNHATANTATWTTADDIPSWNTAIGFTLLEYITLLLATIPPMSLVPDLNQIPA